MSRSRVIALLLTQALFSACGSTAPSDPAEDGGVTIRLLHRPDAATIQVVDDQVMASCHLSIEATRQTNLSIGLVALRVTLYADAAMRQPFDSIFIAGDSLEAGWSGPLLPDGSVTGAWTVVSSRPFYLKGRLRYLWGGTESETGTFAFSCLPDASGASQGPSISGLSVALADSVDPTEPLVVRYTVQAPSGSWQESIRLTGACDTLVQRSTPLETTIAREAAIVLPWECRLGAALQVHVKVTDVRQRSAELDATQQPLVADRFRPTLTSAPLVGEFAVGAEFRPVVTFHENLGPTTIVWTVEPYGARDSVRWGGNGAAVTLRIPAQSNWSGPVSLKIFARDDQGLVSDTLRSVSDSLRVFPSVDRPVMQGLPNGFVRTLVIDPKRDRAYALVGFGPTRVSVWSLSTYQEMASYPVLDQVTTLDITPSGDSLLTGVGFKMTMGVIDLTAASPSNHAVPISHPSLVPNSTWSLVAGTQGRAYVGDFRSMVEINLAGLQTRQLRGFGSSSLFRSPDGRVIAVLDGRTANLLHAGDSTFFATTSVPGSNFFPISFTRDAGLISLGLRLYGPNLAFLRELPATGQLVPREDVQLSPDGAKVAYLDQQQNGIVLKSVATGRAIERIPIPARGGNQRLRFSSDGQRLVLYDISNPATLLFVDLAQPGGVSGSR